MLVGQEDQAGAATLMPMKRWKTKKDIFEVGDVVMMLYSGNLKNDYRLARVLEVFPDKKGLVRTVKVGFRRRDKREKSDVYWKKKLSEEIVAVQRLALLQVAGEALPTGGAQDQLPAASDVRVAFLRAALQETDFEDFARTLDVQHLHQPAVLLKCPTLPPSQSV